jgi:large subunit ribosomal protein L15
MQLHQLEKPPGSTRKPKRKGRGHASTLGKTAGRGQKGQRARGKVAPGFEGGQTPLRRRLPRRGFKNPFKTQYHVVNLGDLARRPALADKTTIGPEELVAARVISATKRRPNAEGEGSVRLPKYPVKVLGQGELGRAVTIHAHRFSRSALEKIKAAGGEAVVIEG